VLHMLATNPPQRGSSRANLRFGSLAMFRPDSHRRMAGTFHSSGGDISEVLKRSSNRRIVVD